MMLRLVHPSPSIVTMVVLLASSMLWRSYSFSTVGKCMSTHRASHCMNTIAASSSTSLKLKNIVSEDAGYSDNSEVASLSRRNSMTRLLGNSFLGIALLNGVTANAANAAVAAKAEVSTAVTTKVAASASVSTSQAPSSSSPPVEKSSTGPPPSAAPGPKGKIKLENPGDIKNCSDFATYKESKEWFDRYYDLYGDIAKLDKNSNMIPCESLPGAPSLQKKK